MEWSTGLNNLFNDKVLRFILPWNMWIFDIVAKCVLLKIIHWLSFLSVMIQLSPSLSV